MKAACIECFLVVGGQDGWRNCVQYIATVQLGVS
jgi:hypothetical protein